MEEWKNGRKEEWKDGMVEDWKNVAIRQFDNSTMEEWKNARFYHGDTENTEMEGNADCQLPYALWRLPTGNCPLSHCPTANWRLPTSSSRLFFSLRFALCALPSEDF